MEEVPGSNPGGPIIFRRKIEGCQSNPAGGEGGLGQGWVFGGQYPGGPIIFRRKIEGCHGDQADQLSGTKVDLSFLEVDFQNGDAQAGARLVDFS